MRFLSCNLELHECVGAGLVPALLRWWFSTCTEEDPLEIDLSGEEQELEAEIDEEQHAGGATAAAAATPPEASAPPPCDARLARREADEQAAAAQLQACRRGTICRRTLSDEGLLPAGAQPTPAYFRQGRNSLGLGKVLQRKEKRRQEKPRQNLKEEAQRGRRESPAGLGLPGRREWPEQALRRVISTSGLSLRRVSGTER